MEKLKKEQPEKAASSGGESEKNKARDTGRERMAKNVWIGWSAQFIYLAAGFVLPRMIDHSMDRQALGAWDFSWTLITYFGLVQAGVVSSVNRYIARYRAKGDVENVNISVSSVGCVLLVMALVIVGVTLSAYHLLPGVMEDKLGAYTHSTQWVVLWLGLGLAFQTAFALFGGVLAGHFRWDIHFYINMASRLATLVGMIAVLLLHGSLSTLGFVYFASEASVLSLRVIFAYRVCPDLRLGWKYVRLQRAKEMLHFGLKIYLPSIGEMLTNQTMNMFIVWFFGPAFLALYSRPRGLIRQLQTFLNRYALVLVPTASSIHARRDGKDMQDLLIEGARNSAYILLPAVIFLAVCGDSLLAVWMGSQYVKPYLFLVMLLTFLPPVFHSPLVRIMMGANIHGRLGVAQLAASGTGLLMVYILFTTTTPNIFLAMAAFALPIWLGIGLYTPYYAHKNLGMPLRNYVHESIVKPLILLSPYLAVLVVIRFFMERPGIELLNGILVSVVILPPLYWRFVLTKSFKRKLYRRMPGWMCRTIA